MSEIICKECGHPITEHVLGGCLHESDGQRAKDGFSFCECTVSNETLPENLKQVEANYDALQSPMPCGHLARYAVNGEDGTQYCCMCDREALLTALNVAHNVISKTADCVQLLREVDDRVPGLIYDYYDENTVSLGVRINNAIIELDKVNNQ